MSTLTAATDLFDPAVLADPYPLLDLLRRTDPVHRIAGTGFHLVTRRDLVEEATACPAHFSSNLTAVLVHHADGTIGEFALDPGRTGRHVLATADEPDHRAHRKLVLPALVARRIAALEPDIDRLVVELWRDGYRDGRIEWMSAMADRLPLTVVARLLGLPTADVPRLRELAYGSTELLSGVVTADRLTAAAIAAVELAGYLKDAYDRAVARPGDDLLGDLARAAATGELDDETAVLLLVQLVGAGGESTAGLLGNAMWLLAAHPDVRQRIRADRGLLGPFIEETLRLESPFRAHLRHVVTDCALGGVALRAGDHLLLAWGAANRDPAHVDEPNTLRLDRRSPRGHLAFGRGLHVCIGSALARLEARAALAAVLDRSDWAAPADLGSASWVQSVFVRRPATLPLTFFDDSPMLGPTLFHNKLGRM